MSFQRVFTSLFTAVLVAAAMLSISPAVATDVTEPEVRDRVLLPSIARGEPSIDPLLEQRVASEGKSDAIVTAWTREELDDIEALGVTGYRLRMLPMIYAPEITAVHLELLRGSPAVRSVFSNQQMRFLMEDTTWIVRARETWRSITAGGLGVTGSDAHVAVIDTGADGAHQDMDNLAEFCEAAHAANPLMLACSPFSFESGNAGPAGPANDARKDAVDDPSGAGHGTHVSGTIAGTGDASGGRSARHSTTGLAPAAKIHAYSSNAGVLISILGAISAYDDIIFKKVNLGSGVIAINNSWGNDAPGAGPNYDRNNPVEVAIQAAYLNGILSVFAAGNSGPGHNSVSQYCASPWVVCAAASSKGDSLGDFSSRGRPAEPADTNDNGLVGSGDVAFDNHDRRLGQALGIGVYRPTLSAPGVQIRSAAANSGCGEGSGPDRGNCYIALSGTSMAAPHVTGAVALITEAFRKVHGEAPHPGIIIDILERSANLTKLPGYEAEEQGVGRLDVFRAVKFAQSYPEGLPPVNLGASTPRFSVHPGQKQVLLNRVPGCTSSASEVIEHDPLTGTLRAGQHFVDVPSTTDRLRIRWDFPSLTGGTAVAGVIGLRAFAPGVNADSRLDPAGPTRAFASAEGGRTLDIRAPEPGRWTVRVYATADVPPVLCSLSSQESPKQTEGFNYVLSASITRSQFAPSVEITSPAGGSAHTSRYVELTGTAAYPAPWEGITNYNAPGSALSGFSFGEGGSLVTATTLHLDGNVEDGCSGDGAADIFICDGPFARESSDRVLSSSPSASWKVADPLFDSPAARDVVDPNWLWDLDGTVTLAGPMTFTWWASCSVCSVAAQWDLNIFADGVKVFSQRVAARPALPEVPDRLSATVDVAFARASDEFVFQIDPVFIDAQSDTKIYYDSELPCPGVSTSVACDSFVIVPVTSNDFVPPPPGPAAPVNVRVTDRHDGLRVAWSGISSAATYEIYRSADPALAPNAGTLVATTQGLSCNSPDNPTWPGASSPGLCFTDSSVELLRTYYYRVVAVNASGVRGTPSLLSYGAATSFDRAVRIRLDRGFGQGLQEYATLGGPDGTAWTHVWDTLELIPGVHALAAGSYTQGIGSVPFSAVVEIVRGAAGCTPQGVGFWRQQARQDRSAKFTQAEYDTLAERAAALSESSSGIRYFASGASVSAALITNPIGAEGAEQRAARQYAALLLNFAAYELSGSMSYRTGLNPDTLLDGAVYNTLVVGDTAGEAAAWIRSQLPDGDLGNANRIGDQINSGQGLICT